MGKCEHRCTETTFRRITPAWSPSGEESANLKSVVGAAFLRTNSPLMVPLGILNKNSREQFCVAYFRGMSVVPKKCSNGI